MFRLRLQQMQNGTFYIKYKWHWWSLERHTHQDLEGSWKLIQALLKVADDHWDFEKHAAIHDE